MGLAVSQCTEMNLMNIQSDTEIELTFITNNLMQLAMQGQSITEQQSREGQIYMNQHKDEEGQIDQSAIEYVNSAAFNTRFDSLLSAIHTKEQALTLRKTQLETRQKTTTTQRDGWEKVTDKNIQATFKRD